jgi:NADPH-dependent ferric siderophore reductase
MNEPTSSRRVQRVRYELRRREVEVVRRHELSPGFTSLTFGGESLSDFESGSFDDHVKFMFDADGPEPVRRDYTPRKFDRAACQLTIEFALHGHGPAAEWARAAAVGQRARIGGPRGSMIIPTDYEWHLLAGDTSALPAIRRRLEELPAGSRTFVVLQLPADDCLPFNTQAALALHRVDDAAAMTALIRSIALPAGDGFAWAAGEAAEMADLRNMLFNERGIAKENMRVAAYWKRGATAHHENLE